MKKLIFVLLFFTFSFTQAKDLELIVLKQGEILSSTFAESSREMIFRVSTNLNNKEISKWVDVPGGKKCVLGPGIRDEYDYPDCSVYVVGHMAMRLNNRYDLPYEKTNGVGLRAEARGTKHDGKISDFISDEDLEKLRNSDLTDNGEQLTLIYDVNNATPFLENNEYYLKQIRVFFDRATGKVDRSSIEKIVIPTPK